VRAEKERAERMASNRSRGRATSSCAESGISGLSGMNAARRVPASSTGTLPRVLLLLDRRAGPGRRTGRVLKGERDREKANPLLRAGRV